MSDDTTLTEQIEHLETRATNLHAILPLAPRAFVVELAGTPKSGKSTSVEAIRHFFKRFGFRVHVLTERADQCPIPMKGHLFFNTWCATSTLAELLENVETPTDLIIVDRGLFDALIWFRTQAKRGELSATELRHIEDFLLMDRWKDLFDLVAVLHADATTALQRENAQRLTTRPGSIMNSSMLETLSGAVTEAVDHYRPRFKKLIVHDTGKGNVRAVNADLLGQILLRFEAFVNPEVLVVPKRDLEDHLSNAPSAFAPADEAASILATIAEKGTYRRRAGVETDPTFVQVVPCGILLYEQSVFLFQRPDKNPKSHLYGTSTIWQGCHVDRPSDGEISQATVLSALQARIARTLFISRQVRGQYVGYTWDPSCKGDGKHLGLIFRLDIESEDLAQSLKKKEFRRGRGHDLAGQLRRIDDLASSMDEVGLEPWSRTILDNFERVLQ